jgi:hypothetical protein
VRNNELSGVIPGTLTQLKKTTFRLKGNIGLCRLDAASTEVSNKCAPIACPYPTCAKCQSSNCPAGDWVLDAAKNGTRVCADYTCENDSIECCDRPVCSFAGSVCSATECGENGTQEAVNIPCTGLTAQPCSAEACLSLPTASMSSSVSPSDKFVVASASPSASASRDDKGEVVDHDGASFDASSYMIAAAFLAIFALLAFGIWHEKRSLDLKFAAASKSTHVEEPRLSVSQRASRSLRMSRLDKSGKDTGDGEINATGATRGVCRRMRTRAESRKLRRRTP